MSLRKEIIFPFAIILWLPSLAFAQYDSIYHDGTDRTYLLHLPAGYSVNDSFPLVIALHGGFGSAYNLQNQAMLSAKSDEAGFIVVYPEGIKGGILHIRTWNAGWCCGFSSESGTDDVGFINALLDKLIDQYSIDENRIYVTGMSNGGFMAYRLACELSERIAAIAPVAASMSMVDCQPARAVPVIHFHSYQDSSVLYDGGIGTGISNHYNPPLDSVLNVWSDFNGCDKASDTLVHNHQYTHVQWTSCDCKANIHYYITRDGGHSWPGGNQTPVGDPVSAYIHATDLMWTFFQQHALDCNATNLPETGKTSNGYTLFPNPVTGTIRINGPDTLSDLMITLHNISGQIIMRADNPYMIDLSELPEGVYIISLRTKDGVTVIKTIKTNPR